MKRSKTILPSMSKEIDFLTLRTRGKRGSDRNLIIDLTVGTAWSGYWNCCHSQPFPKNSQFHCHAQSLMVFEIHTRLRLYRNLKWQSKRTKLQTIRRQSLTNDTLKTLKDFIFPFHPRALLFAFQLTAGNDNICLLLGEASDTKSKHYQMLVSSIVSEFNYVCLLSEVPKGNLNYPSQIWDVKVHLDATTNISHCMAFCSIAISRNCFQKDFSFWIILRWWNEKVNGNSDKA